MKKLWLRITLGFFVISIIGLGIIWFFMSSINRTSYEEMIETHLSENGSVISSSIEASGMDIQNDNIVEWFNKLDLPKDVRFTLIDSDGEVIFDNDNHTSLMENHLKRPEVEAAKKSNDTSQSFIRYSKTEEIDMMYVAKPIHAEGEIVGYIRTATPLYTIDNAVKQMWWTLFVVFLFIFVASLISAALLAYSVTKPINKIMEVTNRLKHQDYSARINEKFTGELYDLAGSINVLASSLQKHVTEIEDQTSQLDSILSNLVTGVILINHDGNVEMVNKAATELLGKSSDILVNNHYRANLMHLNIDRMIRQVVEEDEPRSREVSLYTPNEVILEVNVAPYYGQSWEKRGVIIALHNITKLKHLEGVRRDFVANVSHELKTPVTSVRGFAETILQNEMPKETEREFIQIIYDESDRLNTIISDLLNLSKIEKNDLQLNIEKIDLVKLIHKTAKPLLKAFSDKKLTLNLPNKGRSIELFADKDRIAQILVNLLSNAVNYTPEGGMVSVKVREKKNRIVFSVKDTGIGIPQSSIDRLFERFYRVDTARARNEGGTGLGLAIVKHLVDLHGGTITVDSVENEYTEFTVDLPAER
ncbi:PAS domain-containing sensor histidine kinase [Phocicoccus schoeneichii]|uniref:histidine kinase n=1 Tax=Phocicoccus schoeneichii TaxID=1812261 RepID=A0A6V7R5G1_9BACL|nr:ATP-binding protein [Jeotgalicoccus schoeneichii]GGH51522.1 PAS domain-containing sensor histidine kinase [Jeotgalicoccus schoeneichii]CAD2072556.1 Alkaline phosphatase synthesis sensor protein PhoR [Jeotgalicoccus schoeneichii]